MNLLLQHSLGSLIQKRRDYRRLFLFQLLKKEKALIIVCASPIIKVTIEKGKYDAVFLSSAEENDSVFQRGPCFPTLFSRNDSFGPNVALTGSDCGLTVSVVTQSKKICLDY